MGTRSTLETSTTADPDASRIALQGIVISRTFSKAPRLCSLLQYIVENSVTGKFDNLTEQQIGIQVFNRSPGYNSGEDTIVRGTARHLRHRLEQYYADEGQTDCLRISVPKGAYVARFETVDGRAEPPNPIVLRAPSRPGAQSTVESPSTPWPLAARAALSLSIVLAFLLPLAVYLWLRPNLPAQASHEPQILWHMLFTQSIRPSLSPEMEAWTPTSPGNNAPSPWKPMLISPTSRTLQ